MLIKRVALVPLSIVAMFPQGPLMFGPVQTAASWPFGSSTKRQPCPLVRVVPSWLGVLPTMTQPALQHRHRGGQADPARALRQVARQLGEEPRLPGQRVVGDDRRAGALQVRHIVEIVDENVAVLDFAGGDRGDDNRVRIEVAVVGDWWTPACGDDVWREKARRIRRSRRNGRHRQKQRCRECSQTASSQGARARCHLRLILL